MTSLGHAPPEITEALIEQSRRLIHVSNLYYHAPQGRLAQALVNLIAPGKCFFCNSGAEADEGLFKLARKFGHDEGRFEIITALNSFHGRTMAGIAATGQEKVKKGFEPIVAGFRHVPFNDLAAMRAAISPATAAIMVEGIQGEGGINVGDTGISAWACGNCATKRNCCCCGMACNAGYTGPDVFKAISGFWKVFPAANGFCRTPFRWRSH